VVKLLAKEGIMKKRLFLAVLLSWSFLSLCEAQLVKNGGLSGKVITVTADVVSQTPVPLFATPATGFLVITQFCSVDGDPLNLRGRDFGLIVKIVGADRCAQFTPGIVIPQNELLFCDPETTSSRCMLIGILSK
jgi:hypothetical protein